MSDDAEITIDEGDGSVLVIVKGSAQGMTVHLRPEVAREVAAHLVKYADHIDPPAPRSTAAEPPADTRDPDSKDDP